MGNKHMIRNKIVGIKKSKLQILNLIYIERFIYPKVDKGNYLY